MTYYTKKITIILKKQLVIEKQKQSLESHK